VPAAALYLCRAGAANGPQGLYDAIFSYNHADWYVKMVLELAARYR
jgi:membrane-bound lytic murein transglycosylase B